MNRAVSLCPLLASALVAGFLGFACSSGSGGGGGGQPTSVPTPSFGLKSEVVTPAAQADALAFAPDGRLFYAEHWTGDLRVISAEGQLLPEPFAHVDVAAGIQIGVTGLALDPEFQTNHYVYVFYTEPVAPGTPLRAKPVLVRLTESANKGTNATKIVDDLPEVNQDRLFDVNGSIHFGPDGFLYVTLGDYDRPRDKGPQGNDLPKDLGTPIGKMLRLNKEDGSAAPDNPFATQAGADPRIFAYGFRGSFNFAFHPQTGRIYGSDNSGATCEELNIIEKGTNYGWPQAADSTARDCPARQQLPAFYFLARNGMKPEDFDSTVGVRGMEFVSGGVYPMLGDSLLLCEERTQLIRRLVLGGPNFDQVTADDVVARDCWLDITTSPQGIVYYSNLTEIRRLLPPAESPSPSLSAPASARSSP